MENTSESEDLVETEGDCCIEKEVDVVFEYWCDLLVFYIYVKRHT